MKFPIKELFEFFSNVKISSNSKNLKVDCPKCGKNECYVSIHKENHPGRCWREIQCGHTFNIFSILKSLGRLEEFTSDYRSYTEELNYSLLDKSLNRELPELVEVKLPIGFREITQSDYLDSREFVQIDYQELRPGISKLSPRYKDNIIFPVIENNKTVGFISRSIHSKEKCKELGVLRYQKSETDFEHIIYGLSENTNIETTILVEGIFDYRKVKRTLELYQLDYFVFPLLGVFLSPIQVLKLKDRGCKNLIFLLDPDIEPKLREFSKNLLYDFNCFISSLKENDPGDSSYQEILLSLEDRELLESYLINQLPKKSLYNE